MLTRSRVAKEDSGRLAHIIICRRRRNNTIKISRSKHVRIVIREYVAKNTAYKSLKIFSRVGDHLSICSVKQSNSFFLRINYFQSSNLEFEICLNIFQNCLLLFYRKFGNLDHLINQSVSRWLR